MRVNNELADEGAVARAAPMARRTEALIRVGLILYFRPCEPTTVLCVVHLVVGVVCDACLLYTHGDYVFVVHLGVGVVTHAVINVCDRKI